MYIAIHAIVWIYNIWLSYLFISWWTFGYFHFFLTWICFHFSWVHIYLEVELLDKIVILRLTFLRTAKPFSSSILHSHQQYIKFQFLPILNTCYHLTFWLLPSYLVWSDISLLAWTLLPSFITKKHFIAWMYHNLSILLLMDI
jgi:hypothetical protein